MPEILAVLLIAAPALGLALFAWQRVRAVEKRLAIADRQVADAIQQLELVRQSISGLTAGAVGMDRRVHRLEQRERALSERQEDFEMQQSDDQPYGQAIRLVQQGAATGRLVAELGLSESEAELIERLHGRRDSA